MSKPNIDNISKRHILKNINDNVELALFNIVANMPGHVYWKNIDGVYLGCNDRQARSLGFSSADEVIGKTDYDLPWAVGVAEKFRENDIYVMKTGITQVVEEPSQMDGKQVIVLSQKTPLKDMHGETSGVLGISLDITDRKKMEEDLRIAKEKAEAASIAKTAFIANISHDTRLPLTGVIGLSSALEEDFIPDAERIEYAKMIHESGDALLAFSESVLDDVTASSMTKDAVIHESFDVRKIMNDVMALERPTTRMNHLSLGMYIDPAIPPYLVGDKKKLHCILLNLTGNAIKFTKVGGIELKAQLIEGDNDLVKIEFSVKDSGIGIAEEHQSKVFEQFYKIMPSYKGLYKGYGLGLHLVHTYVGLLGGEIKLRSELGVGTTFSFILTLQVGQNTEHEKVDAIQDELLRMSKTNLKVVTPSTLLVNQSLNPNKIQVLLVEDNTTAMKVLKVMMQKYDVQISTAIDAELALDLVKSQHFDLIITDIGLPGQSGDEMTVAIRAHEQEKNLTPMVIVGLTGHALEMITQTCLNSGMNEVYRKPMTSDALKKLIDGLLMPKSASTIKEHKLSGLLGVDLPDTEAQLFEIGEHPLLDMQVGMQSVGNEDVLLDIFKNLKEQGIMADLAIIQKAHESGDWKTVEKYTHKIKGGACYGTVRLYYALLYMERYLKAGHTHCSEALYAQMLRVINETMVYLDAWLET